MIIDGFIGRVEFGSKTGSQFPAGKSYQGAVGSPCIAGITQGAVFAALAMALAELSNSAPLFPSSLEDGASSTAARSCSTKSREKYLFSSHSPIKSWIFRMCFGQLMNDAALLIRVGSVGSSFWGKVSS